MALGIRRSRFGFDATRLFSVRAVTPFVASDAHWTRERGRLLVETQADVSGGFPGFADLGAILPGAQVRITDTFVTVDEGQARGFGLPVDWIDGFAPISGDADDAPLLVRYHDGVVLRTVQFRFRAARVGPRGNRRSARVQSALADLGIPLLGTTLGAARPFCVRWDEASAFESEAVVWSGTAAAPVQIGGGLVASEIWLTTKSLIWGSGAGEGITRVPLEYLIELVSTRLRDRIGTPAIYLAVDCDPIGRIEAPFVFNRLTPPDHNFRERAGMLDGLRALAIPDGEPVPYWQPWRNARRPTGHDAGVPPAPDEDRSFAADMGFAEDPITADEEAARPAPDTAHDGPVIHEPHADQPIFLEFGAPRMKRTGDEFVAAPVDREAERESTPPATPTSEGLSSPDSEPAKDLVLAVWNAPSERAAVATDTAIAHGWSKRAALAPVYQSEPTSTGELGDEPAAMAEEKEPEPLDPWTTIRRYEATALDALDELFHAIDRRAAGRNPIELVQSPPNSRDQARALAELTELLAIGEVTQPDAARRRERLLALGDICVRLRTLIELHASGYLTDADLGLKRKKLVDGLSISLVRM